MPFNFKRTDLEDVILIDPKVFDDDRGFFLETYKFSEFEENGITETFIQDNHSQSTKGVLRGLHYQLNPCAQGKLVRCLFGEIFDVAVDIRKGSPSFGKWVGKTLSAKNKHLLYVPPGFAHGFVTLSDVAEIAYKVTAEYSPECDRGIRWNDPEIGIDWPVNDVILSEKDEKSLWLKDADVFNFEKDR